jgi:hypothetical protein
MFQLCFRQQPQIAGPFQELVKRLRILHLQPQRAFATGSSDSADTSSSSSGQEGTKQGAWLDCAIKMLEAHNGTTGPTT